MPLRRRPPVPPLRRWATARTSPLLPGLRLAWADLHNHTLLSDGDGAPEDAFAQMREAGVDVAAVTDHAASGRMPVDVAPEDRPHVAGTSSIDEDAWARLAEAADAADDPGSFVAVRGFEWSSPVLGHVNVWGSDDWVDPLSSGATPTGSGPYGDTPPGATVAGLHAWLRQEGGAPFGLNHPGRERGRFETFAHDPALTRRLVTLEMFNRDEDYLFEGTEEGGPSPLVACLAAGWRPGLLGVSDHHGTRWGAEEGAGRGILWLPEVTREAAREALDRRLLVATREPGLRFVVLAGPPGGPREPMGSAVAPDGDGVLRLTVDVDRLPDPDLPHVPEGGLRGRRLVVQLLGPGSPLPRVVDAVWHDVPAGDDAVPASFDVELDDADDWLVVRLVDPELPSDARATGDLAAGRTLAYASPFWLLPRG